MAFSFPSPGTGGGGFGGQTQSSNDVQILDGPELREIQTKKLGFSAINGEAKLKLLPTPWPKDSLPPPTSSLLCVASGKGLLAAAGPDRLVLASTKDVREALLGAQDPSANARTVKPEVNLAVPRLSQIAFSADENVLVVSGQENGGLAAYQVDRLLGGQTDPALQLSTNDSSLRALVPNPAPESTELFALVTTNGELLLADLKSGGLRSGSDGPVLKNGVSCVSWSNKGKQLVAGSADGTATQLKPDGSVVQQIPKPTTLPPNMHMSSVSWLENDSFLVIYTSTDTSNDETIPPSDYYIITRQKGTSNYAFHKLPEVCIPFGMHRTPTFHFIVRLRNYEPHIQDLLILASTTSPDLGTVTKTDTALSEEAVTGAYTNTIIESDSRRAGLPLDDNLLETSPIGMSLDLSSTEPIVKPIPDDPEIEQSSTPLPNLLLLNHEGTLCSWWVVHDDSIREKIPFRGLAYLNGAASDPPNPATSREATPAQISAPSSGGFGQPGFGTVSEAKPASPFAAASTVGSSTTLSGAKPSWASTGFGTAASTPTSGSGFGQPGFGAATPIGGSSAPAFGTPSPFASRPAPFGQPAVTPASGQPAGLGARSNVFGSASAAASPFAAAANQKTPAFASFATSSSGFAALGSTEASPFAKALGTGDFGKLADSSPFAAKPAGGADFGGVVKPNSGSPFAGATAPFKLESSFRGDGTAQNDLPKPANPGGFGFGNSFGDMLGDSKRLSPTHDKEEDMEDGASVQSGSEDSNTMTNSPRLDVQPVSETQKPFTPPSTINQTRSTPTPAVSSLFGPPNPTQTTTPQTIPQTSTGFSFGAIPSTTPKDPPASTHTSLFGTVTQPDTTPADVTKSLPTQIQHPPAPADDEDDASVTPQAEQEESETPRIKAEPPSDDETPDLSKIPEAPLPPDPTSKASYSPGDTSAASSNHSRLVPDDAPLPPDFAPANKTAAADVDDGEHSEGAGEYSSDFEGSGEDVTQDISPTEEASAEPTEQVHTSPESSFNRSDGQVTADSPTGGLFTNVTKVDPATKPTRTLFGEVGIGPIFPPPKQQESPRSPSPIRNNNVAAPWLRPEAVRAVSAPSHPPSVIEKRRADLDKTKLVNPVAKASEIRAAKEKAEADARAAAKARAEEEAKELEDNEDERLREELNRPVSPCQELQEFMPYQPGSWDELSKAGIPGQIERLYRDINSMIDTLGINARSLSAFMLYQQSQQLNSGWPDVLHSETPLDALNDEWVLDDTRRLHEGDMILHQLLEARQIEDVAEKLQSCQELLSRDLYQLRLKLSMIRKTIHAKTDVESNLTAPLSAEQTSIQHDLRKASTAVQMKLSTAEQNLAVLRAKLAEVAPAQDKGRESQVRTGLPRSLSQKKPTVEAVTNTIAKMTSMAEKKSADIDVLEAQLRKLGIADEHHRTSRQAGTPEPANLRTPASAINSVYHTPDSRFSDSTRSMRFRGSLRESLNGSLTLVSTEERERWQEKAQRKREVTSILKGVLSERRRKKLMARPE